MNAQAQQMKGYVEGLKGEKSLQKTLRKSIVSSPEAIKSSGEEEEKAFKDF